jgi:polyribonucleotide nucleotidyltransferase
MRAALAQGAKGRAHILGEMAACAPPPRRALSQYAPVITLMRIDRNKIGALIGPVRGRRVGRRVLGSRASSLPHVCWCRCWAPA